MLARSFAPFVLVAVKSQKSQSKDDRSNSNSQRKLGPPSGHGPPDRQLPAARHRPRGPRTSVYKYVRRRLGKFQARIYQRNLQTGFAEWLNLGLYKTEWDAWQAVLRFVRTGKRPDKLLPKYVKRCVGGGFVGAIKLSGRKLIKIGPFATPQEADVAMRAKLLDIFGDLSRFYPFG